LVTEFKFAEFYEIYANRVKDFAVNQPGKDWNGVNDMPVK
jgi:hypothetical protein